MRTDRSSERVERTSNEFATRPLSSVVFGDDLLHGHGARRKRAWIIARVANAGEWESPNTSRTTR